MLDIRPPPDWIRLTAGIALAATLGAALAQSESQSQSAEDAKLSEDSDSKQWWRDVDFTLPGAFADWHIFQKDGLRVDRGDGDLRLKFNANLWVDGGRIGTNDALETAFPDLPGTYAMISRARITMRGWAFAKGDFKIQVEFAQTPQVKDSWFRLRDVPYLGNVRLGNMREPYSLQSAGGGGNLTFLDRPLPTLALAPGRNIGLAANDTAFDDRMTWAAGWFWNTGSFGEFFGAKDAVDQSIGSDLVARVTGLARYANEGRELTHLGLSLRRQRFHDQVQTRATPETWLTDENLVDTGQYSADSGTHVNAEFAIVSGPWSFQAEYFQSSFNASGKGTVRFDGIYGFASYAFTGESRHYDRATGVFDGLRPKRKFEWGSEGWGAWEVALRLSHVDLSDGAIRGGRQTDVTAGLNWYINDDSRLMLNYVHGRVNDRSVPPAVDGGRVNIFQARFAIDF